MLSTERALLYTALLGAVIFFCRVLPFIVFRDGGADTGTNAPGGGGRSKIRAFLGFVENAAPPAAMTVLAFNALASPVRELFVSSGAARPADFAALVPLGAASVFTAAVHLWKRNALLSIFGGTALYMLLERAMPS